MSRAQSSSSCSHNSWLMRNQSLSCNSGGCRGLGEAPTCNCGVEVVLRTARTVKNGGREFWECPNFKGGSGASYGCNFFKWCIEDGDDKKDATILRQRQKIYILEKEVKGWRKWVNLLIGVVCLLVVVNVILVSMMLM
ncbi:uncharacterized protein LOC114180910 [Vigna unguiculata]|uniref:AP endonuclease 2 n=1 Tax=Vigna unguiculata TaxID=3917 RepID=A0A4D6M1G2_VIGUN|nr:uncharacterized protein LOC114180910 [Vigna unguiculata]QCD94935.1 AP endonuclease 2 [Vigna unguiculata]